MRVRPATHPELPRIFAIASEQIPELAAALPQVERVMGHDPESILVFDRDGEPVGLYAMLLLNGRGMQELLLGTLNTVEPEVDSLIGPGSAPVAIYNWAVVAPRLAAEGFRHMSVFLRRPRFRHANIYARGTTPSACKIMVRTGYEPQVSGYPDLYRYVRLPNRNGAGCTAA